LWQCIKRFTLLHVKLNDAHTHGKTANYFNCLSRHYSLFKCAQTANVLVYMCASGRVYVCDMYSHTQTYTHTFSHTKRVGQSARHTQAAVYIDMKLAQRKSGKFCCRLPHLHTKNSLSLTSVLSLSFSPIRTLALALFLCSVSVSHLISENKY